MTKVLIISNKSDLTCDFIIKKLTDKKVSFYRFNTEELTNSISVSLNFQEDLFTLFDSKTNSIINLKEFTSVYYRRPEVTLINNSELSSAEIAFLRNEILFTLEGIYKVLKNCFWLSPIYSIRESENKIHQLITAKSLGFKIPPSIITTKLELVSDFFVKNENDCIIKPIKSGLIEDNDDSKVVFTTKVISPPKSKEQIETCPSFFQRNIEKRGDVRVTVVGKKIFATLIHSQESSETMIDWRRGQTPLKHSKIDLPKNIEEKCLLLLSELNLQFGAIDFIIDKNENYIFLEINPNGQWAWIERQTGYEISDEIVKLLINGIF